MHSRADIDSLLKTHGLAARREFGQNFVADPNTVRKIVRLAQVSDGVHVVEIGPGLGSLTLALAEVGAVVLALEVDRGVVPVLQAVVAGHANVTVRQADAMRVDWDAALIAADSWRLVANLPYNIATPLICDLLDLVPKIERMLVMVQREVGERICAAPRTPAYGAVSVKVAHWATARIAAHVPPTVFVPRPNVDSALVEIIRRPSPATDAPASEMFPLVRTAFGQRRKMLRRSLHGIVSADTFAAAGIDPQRRPEELSVVEWGALTNAHLVAS
jgi:16S rRNA (adenine1518-N6/adenine1519-N6)-dimethyltransferase